MGDETIQFASRFAQAVELLGRLATDRGHAALRKKLGPALDGAVRDALDAVAALHETGTDALKRWAERREEVLARVSALRAALARGGVDEAVRREAGALVRLLEPGGPAAR